MQNFDKWQRMQGHATFLLLKRKGIFLVENELFDDYGAKL